MMFDVIESGVRSFNPPAQLSKALQNRAKINPIVKTVKKFLNLGCKHHKMFGKMAIKF